MTTSCRLRKTFRANEKKNEFVNVEYPIPANLTEGKTSLTVKFQPQNNHVAGGVFRVRLLAPKTTDIFDLALRISKSNDLSDSATEGTETGTYPVDAITAFRQIIEASQAIAGDTDAEQAAVDTQIAILKAACQNFLASVNGITTLIRFNAGENNQVIDLTENNYTATLKNGATTPKMGNFTVINLGAANGYMDMSAQAGNTLPELSDFSVSVYYLCESRVEIIR